MERNSHYCLHIRPRGRFPIRQSQRGVKIRRDERNRSELGERVLSLLAAGVGIGMFESSYEM